MNRYILMSENGNSLDVGNSLDDLHRILYAAKHCFNKTNVSVIDTEIQREYYYVNGNINWIDWVAK